MVRISEAELEVLQIIWEKKQATSFDIIENLKHKKIASQYLVSDF